MNECKTCRFGVKEETDIRTTVIAFIAVSKKGVRVCCRHRKEISYSCGITDYNEYPDNCPHRLETEQAFIISGDEHKAKISDYSDWRPVGS